MYGQRRIHRMRAELSQMMTDTCVDGRERPRLEKGFVDGVAGNARPAAHRTRTPLSGSVSLEDGEGRSSGLDGRSTGGAFPSGSERGESARTSPPVWSAQKNPDHRRDNRVRAFATDTRLAHLES